MGSYGKFDLKKGIGNVNYHYEKRSKDIDIELYVDLSRFKKQYSDAQFALDSKVMTGMQKFMPMESGVFVDVTKKMSDAIAGSGKVYAAAPPMGRFLYEGKTMVDEKTGSPWARKAARKVLVSQYGGKTNARENLVYTKTKHPQAQSHWFEAAKKVYGKSWADEAKKIAGGG